MNTEAGRLIDTLDRVEEFIDANADRLETVLAPVTRDKLSGIRERLVGHMKAQGGNAGIIKSRVAIKTQLKDELYFGHLRPIARLARAEDSLSSTAAAGRLPSRRGRTAALVAGGYAMAEVARQHEQAFVTAGIRPDFIDRLIAATDAVRDSESAKSQIVALRVEATAGLHRQIREARRYLRALDGFVRAALKAEDGLLARWTHLSRVVPEPEAQFTEVIVPSQPATPPAGPNAGSPSSERDDALAGRRAESPLNAAA